MNGVRGGSGILKDDYFLKYRDEKVFQDKKHIEECFKYFDNNQ